MEDLIINVAKDFTEFPGARFKKDGDFSGEEFFEKYLDNTENYKKIEIILDGTYGYPSSFLSEAFTRFYDKYGEKGWKKINFISEEDPSLISFIKHLVKRNEK